MRSVEEQMKEIKRRRDISRAGQNLRRKMIGEAAFAGVCAAMMIIVACLLPEVRQASEQSPVRQYGSMILKMPAAGYVLIALLAFALGVAVTLLCQHWKERKALESEKEREDE